MIDRPPKTIATPERTRQRLRDLRSQGHTMQRTADMLNAEELWTATGRPWSWQNVQRVEASLRLDDEAAARRSESSEQIFQSDTQSTR